MPTSPSDTGARPPTLRQEVRVLVRGRLGWFVAIYTLACVAAGFSLGAAAFHDDAPPAYSPPPVPRPRVVIPAWPPEPPPPGAKDKPSLEPQPRDRLRR